MKASIKGNKLTIEIDIAPADSKSGKTVVIASSHGGQPTEAQHNGKQVIVNLNAYVKK